MHRVTPGHRYKKGVLVHRVMPGHSYNIPLSVCRLRERGRMSKSVYVRAFHVLELLRYVLRCAIERQL